MRESTLENALRNAVAKLDKKVPRGRGQGGTLIFSQIRRLGLFWGVQTSGFQYFFGFSEK